jgi:hypothetical protein
VGLFGQVPGAKINIMRLNRTGIEERQDEDLYEQAAAAAGMSVAWKSMTATPEAVAAGR